MLSVFVFLKNRIPVPLIKIILKAAFTCETVINCYKTNNISNLKFWFKIGCFNNSEKMFRLACRNNAVEAAEFLLKLKLYIPLKFMKIAILNNKKIFKILINLPQNYSKYETTEVAQYICKKKNTEALKYFLENYRIYYDLIETNNENLREIIEFYKIDG